MAGCLSFLDSRCEPPAHLVVPQALVVPAVRGGHLVRQWRRWRQQPRPHRRRRHLVASPSSLSSFLPTRVLGSDSPTLLHLSSSVLNSAGDKKWDEDVITFGAVEGVELGIICIWNVKERKSMIQSVAVISRHPLGRMRSVSPFKCLPLLSVAIV